MDADTDGTRPSRRKFSTAPRSNRRRTLGPSIQLRRSETSQTAMQHLIRSPPTLNRATGGISRRGDSDGTCLQGPLLT
jgi:hypothetical protein